MKGKSDSAVGGRGRSFHAGMGREVSGGGEKIPHETHPGHHSFPAGDTDNLLRPFVEKMPEYLGQPVTMVYKPGAAGSVGAGFVAASKPDGYLLVGSSHSSIVVVPLTHKDVGYTWKSFAPICAMVEASSLIVVQSDVALEDLERPGGGFQENRRARSLTPAPGLLGPTT